MPKAYTLYLNEWQVGYLLRKVENYPEHPAGGVHPNMVDVKEQLDLIIAKIDAERAEQASEEK